MARDLTVGAGVIVSGEGDFLEYSIRAIRDKVDVIFIVEGADPRWIDLGNAKPNGESLDNTREVIELLMSEPGAPIIASDPTVYRNRNAQRQVYLDYFLKEGLDLCLVLDSDEFYLPSHLEHLFDRFASEPGEVGFKYDFWNFFSWVRRYPQTIEMERCFRLSSGMHYFDKDGGQAVVDSNGKHIWPRFVRDDVVKCFHYNRVRTGRDLLTKIRFYMERDGNATRETKLKLGNIGQDALTAITKNPNRGLFVPLSDQPSAARSLIYSRVSAHASVASALDLAGLYGPMDLSEMQQSANEFADIEFYQTSDLSQYLLCYGGQAELDEPMKGLNLAPQTIELSDQLLTEEPSQGARLVVGSASVERDGWTRIEPDMLAAGGVAPGSVDSIVCEHLLDKLENDDRRTFVTACRTALRVGGRLRVAVPDPKSPLATAANVNLPDAREWSAAFHELGFKADLIEHHDKAGKLITQPWRLEDGYIYRSSHAGGAKSIIIDAFRLF